MDVFSVCKLPLPSFAPSIAVPTLPRAFICTSVAFRACHLLTRRRFDTRCRAEQEAQSKPKAKPVNPLAFTTPSDKEIILRSEAEAPFRIVRLVFYGFFVVSASVAALIATSQTIGALAGASNALPLTETAGGLAIDLGAIALFSYLFARDKQARDKQIARITREEKLGALPVELSNRRMLRMQQLRSFVRPVIVAGTAAQVTAAVQAAEPFKEALAERGVLVIPVPCYEEGTSEPELPALTPEDLRWRANPLRLQAWSAWFNEQAGLAGKTSEQGFYVGLRMDGRVRASGRGIPPWGLFAKQLPPTTGFFQGFFDSFDGQVRSFD